MALEVLRSSLDKSINFVTPTPDGGKIEARFVQRQADAIIVYLSSMTGCNLACRFCHLTQMRQTTMTPVTIDGYLDQASEVLIHAAAEEMLEGVTTVHFNFMARGDALSNEYFINQTELLFYQLNEMAKQFKLDAKFKISTIFPKTLLNDRTMYELTKWVKDVCDFPYDIEFYYSLYSLDERFRKRWLPKAMHPDQVGEIFTKYETKFRLHYALIEGENSSLFDQQPIKQWLVKHKIICRLNIVRYNPFDLLGGKEPSEDDIRTYAYFMKMGTHIIDVHVISRVGYDVKASCGTFV
jgi:adenine C2-methylase RlmN of 23S rRNA A2503 and tRNA A37